jgi:hypothetical protein
MKKVKITKFYFTSEHIGTIQNVYQVTRERKFLSIMQVHH